MPGFQGRYYMWPEEYWLLSKYVDLTQGGYLEIGSMCGIIAMSLAERYPSRRFVCVDKFAAGHATAAGEKEMFLRNLQEHALKNVTLVEGDSLAVVPTLAQQFEIVLIDANHAYDYVLGDALNSWRLLLPGGFLAFHDYGYVEETTRAVNDFLAQAGGRFLESASSLAIVQKPYVDGADHGPDVRAGLHRYMRSQLARVSEEKVQLEAAWRAVENSAGWRILNGWRKLRDRLAPPSTRRRQLYDSLLQICRGQS